MKVFKHILLIISLFSSGVISAQTPSEIKDVINRYVKVNSFEGANSVYVTSASGFAQGDTVMIVQMKGAIYSPDDPNVIDLPANVGKYEFTVINTIAGQKITFNSSLKNTYTSNESVQLIRVPSYTDAVVVSKLTCDPWDGQKGGILALIASRSLTLNADIDVSGKGFRGGAPVTYSQGKCFATSGIPFSRFHILNPSNDSTSGYKGEGIITNQFLYTLGRGPSGNGGGAGTGSYAGGGGGGNSGIGGNGARESCASDEDLNWGGNGGRIDAQFFSNSFSHRRIYLGGGGGSGIQKVNNSGTAGGKGGGIVILLVPYLVTNNNTIKADGEHVSGVVTDGSSSGGGGGGGMVLLAIDSVKNNLRVTASGGNGGGTASSSPCVGQGGGGGGGFVWFSGQSMSFSLLELAGGLSGSGSCDVSSTAGHKGDSLNRLSLPLTGFLNNTIRALNKACYNTRHIIKGSRPQGGNGIYTYQWQYRNYGSSTWLAAPGKNDSVDYRTAFLTDTTQFRRIVSSDGMNDISGVVTINIFPQITNNVVNPDTVLCFGSPGIKIRGSQPGGGIGNFTFEWSRRNLNGTWETAPGIANTRDYNISSDISRYYRRKVTSDYCSTYDSVKVEVLPVISGNTIDPRQTVCSGAVPAPFTGSSPAGGSGTYNYQWQKSSDSLSWSNTAISAKDFGSAGVHTQTTFYRRIVMSGLNNCCRDTSKNIKIIVLPTISNNTISAAQTICEATAPSLLNGSSPGGGDTQTGYRYQWESSKNNIKWDSIRYSPLIKDFQPSPLDTTLSFRRVVLSGLNDCCKSFSNTVKITVQPKIKNNLISGDTTICDNTVPGMIKSVFSGFTGGDGSSYAISWKRKMGTGTWADISGAVQLTYQPPALSDTTSYQRIVTSGTCTDLSNIVVVNALNPIQGNTISGNNVVCDGFPAGQLGSGNLSGGEPGVYRILWEKSSDGNSWQTISGETSLQLLPGILPQKTYFRRIVKSGLNDCCQSTSNQHQVSVDLRPQTPEAGPDRELVYKDTASLAATPAVIGAGIWTTGSGANIVSPESPVTRITGLNFGRYAFYWTVTNGVCPSVSDSVVINVLDLQRYTGFSPNGDGINDFFVVDGLSNAPNRDLTIINRWGVEVYHSGDYQNDWDGRNKKGEPLPEDTYFYVLKVKDIYSEGKNRVYKGYIVIKR